MKKSPNESTVTVSFSGNKEVFERLLLKQKFLKENNPKHEKIRTVLLLPGGGQSGVIEAGGMVALEKLGLSEVFDYVVGVSTGAGVGYYYLAKEAAIGTSIYFQENVKNKMVNFWHPWKIFDIDTLEKVFRNVKPIDQTVLKKSRSTLLIGVTDLATGTGTFLDAKSYEDPIACIAASASIPIVAGGKVMEIDGKQYVDGSPSFPLPISYAVDGLQATDILVVMPQPLEKISIGGPKTKKVIGLLTRILTPTLRESIEEYDTHFNNAIDYLSEINTSSSPIRIGIIHAGEHKIQPYSMNAEELKKGVFASEKLTLELFANAQKHIQTSLLEKVVIFFKRLFHVPV